MLLNDGGGRIVQNSSILGFLTMPYRGAYSASKHALEALSDALRLELRDSGVHISIIEPGPVQTNFRANSFKNFIQWIPHTSVSRHTRHYSRLVSRLMKPGPAAPFTVYPDRVARQVLHAMSARSPRRRYRTTITSRAFWYIRKIAPISVMDRLLNRY